MKYMIFVLVLFCIWSCAKSQDGSLKYFISTFEETESMELIDFGAIVNSGTKMTQSEALKFVYQGDSSKLICKQKVINMENEKESRIVSELYLPEKCFLLRGNNYFLIGHTSYECQDPKKELMRKLTLKTISKNYTITDSLVANYASDFDFQVTGLLNPANKRIFLTGSITQNGMKQAALYEIDEITLNFKRINFDENATEVLDDLKKGINALGWTSDFFK